METVRAERVRYRRDEARRLARTDIHEILGNDRRRRVMERLRRDDFLALSDLSAAIAAAEAGESPPPRRVRRSVYASLHQTHLPKLDSMGVVAYDADAKVVRYEPGAERVIAAMDAVESTGTVDRWAWSYLALSVLALLSFLAHVAGVSTPTFLATHHWQGIVLSVLAVSAAYHCGRRRSVRR
ncbi:DUF7344 domain-containing protein [Halegenticoccus tardaugens]|uniref:DUF7344 domain-containing protein n=1 Tax=Halegenticoccus tardaugens TaxID=2071624 RepID=UPI00100B7250|nr:hypothetical protein [Halegenticoccus tardaugens]